MFVKKDLRKIPKILSDAVAAAAKEPPSDSPHDGNTTVPSETQPGAKRRKREILTELRLSRRQAEFNGSLSILCNPSNAPALSGLVSLSLYDCNIKTLDGIGLLASSVGDGVPCCCPDLRELNVGRNPLETLPEELALLSNSLTTLWCDDCNIAGPLPRSVLQLKKLENLRISQNEITSIPEGIGNLTELQVLCLDGNQIESVPEEVGKLVKLKSLMLRQNKIEDLPEGVPGCQMANLSLLHVSSNKLKSLPASLAGCTSLERVYANANRLMTIPVGIGLELSKMRSLNVSSNEIEHLPVDFVERFGEPDVTTGKCTKDPACVVQMDQNPCIRAASLELKSIDEHGAENGGDPIAMEICAA